LDSATNKMLMIGVGIFITIIITSGVLAIVTQIKNIYADVYNLDTNLGSRFDEFTRYDDTDKTGLDMINAANKYYENPLVIVEYNGRELNNQEGIEYLTEQVEKKQLSYDQKVHASFETIEVDQLERIKIVFVDQ